MVAFAFLKNVQIHRTLSDKHDVDFGAGESQFSHFIEEPADRDVINERFCGHGQVR
ncbi:hypothetical protein [Nitratireductor aquibiodomus]|uniref:hypothetical protein n=1 Tax=Nitratireductor aquibiodomus TaxID=204799 RepID=UPI0012DF2AF4|nr:hypothetical protein [Nitratireductor aquibiodomus]